MDEASKLSPGKTESTAVPSPSTKGGSPEKASEEEVRARLFKGLGRDLLLSIKEGDMHKAQGLIMGGVELDAREPVTGRTALHLAVQKTAMGVVKLLVQHKIDVNAVDRIGEVTALHVAAHRGQMVMLKHLLAAKANLNLVGVEGDTPLSRAATQGHLKVLDSLISNGAICDLKQRQSINEWQQAEIEMKQLALQQSTTASGSQRGRSPTRSMQGHGDRAFQPAVRDRREPVSALVKAVKRNCGIPVVKTLLEIGCDSNRTDEKMNRPLHVAAHYGNANTCRLLLHAKAAVNVGNHLGRTPLHFAARSGHARIFRMLLDYKAEINAEDRFGQTPLTLCCDTMMQKLVKDNGGTPGYSDEHNDVSPPVSPARSLSPARSPSPDTAPRFNPAGASAGSQPGSPATKRSQANKLQGSPAFFQERH
ncbi:unnamed protein product [Amoebophrya sp. A120]|nr:unnamed protein product [Amoebophrya sp. A120]|eukprot:GSA120T00016283001.1